MAANTYHKHHHTNIRKKKHRDSLIDKWVYFAVVFGPIMTLPQIYDIWMMGKKEASVVSWASYVVIAIIWLLYGIKHKEKPIIIVQVIWIILDLTIVIGILA